MYTPNIWHLGECTKPPMAGVGYDTNEWIHILKCELSHVGICECAIINHNLNVRIYVWVNFSLPCEARFYFNIFFLLSNLSCHMYVDMGVQHGILSALYDRRALWEIKVACWLVWLFTTSCLSTGCVISSLSARISVCVYVQVSV